MAAWEEPIGNGFDLVVVGGGLAGLAAAALAGRAGRSVALLEKAREPGGRASTSEENGFRFNFGPHALYHRGRAASVLRDLGVAWSGRRPSGAGSLAWDGGALQPLPTGAWSLLRSRKLGVRDKLELGRQLVRLPRIDPRPLQATSLEAWLRSAVGRPRPRRILEAFFRLATYANAPALLSAGAAIEQLQLALNGGVWYLDGGWQSLVDGLRRKATEAGARILTQARAEALEQDGAVRGVRLADGTLLRTRAAVLAIPPAEASRLADLPVTRRWAQAAVPIQASCLDLGLRSLPRPNARFALGLDRPLYLSVHSAYARLAPESGALIQAAQYLPPDARTDPKAVELELEQLLEAIQPGWRGEVIRRRFLPGLTVCNALVQAGAGGLPGRPGPEVPGVANLYVAGDWVGPEGMLADAALASAARAVRAIMATTEAIAA
jgi:phytoene dehydrogenase-like protein